RRDQVVEHMSGDVAVGDVPVLQWPHGPHMPGRPPEHCLGVASYCDDGLVGFVDGDDGGLVEDDAHATPEHQGVRCAEVDREIIHEHPHQQAGQRRSVHLYHPASGVSPPDDGGTGRGWSVQPGREVVKGYEFLCCCSIKMSWLTAP